MSTLPLFEWKQPEPGDPSAPRHFRVAEINRAVRLSLERDWRDLWVEGELSDVTYAASGHAYFTLNDETDPAQIRGVIFRGDAKRLRMKLTNGARVRMRGSLSLYEPRGSFQLLARTAEPAGDGDLAAQFERVRALLEKEGLLEASRKRKLPLFPRTVGVVTSKTGAAIHDIIEVARNRCPVRIVVSDCRVQGAQAPESIVTALAHLQRLDSLDVVIIGRGGGSAEDLWCFNDEHVARAIASCRVPTVSAVGHEVDFTIADLVADVRAATPSNAAELAVPQRSALEQDLASRLRMLERAWDMVAGGERLRLERLTKRLRDPRQELYRTRRGFEGLLARSERAMHKRLQHASAGLREQEVRLTRRDPRAVLVRDRARLSELRNAARAAIVGRCTGHRLQIEERLARTRRAGPSSVERSNNLLASLTGRLDALSPLKVLGRGYAIALSERTGRALLSPEGVQEGDRITVRLAEGALRTEVLEVEPT